MWVEKYFLLKKLTFDFEDYWELLGATIRYFLSEI